MPGIQNQIVLYHVPLLGFGGFVGPLGVVLEGPPGGHLHQQSVGPAVSCGCRTIILS